MRPNRNLVFLNLVLAAAVTLIVACGRAPGPAPEPKAPAPATPVPLSAWDELVKAAQKEGTVNIYGTSVAPAKGPVREAFRQKFGINLEFVDGRGPEVVAKLSAERRAGLSLADVGHVGEITAMDIKALGITAPVTDLLTLPEVTNPQSWIGAQLPFFDKEKHIFMFMATAFPQVVINTEVVKEAEVASFFDLLNPRWKGKIVFSDPTVAGGSPYMLAALYKTLGKDRALEAFQQLAAQEPVLTRDQRQLLEWVARAKYPIGLGYSAALFTEFKKAGAPVKMHSLKEPRHIYAGPGALTVFSQNPNPKAGRLYVNWLLSKEGALISSKAFEFASTRVDVSREWLQPEVMPRADDIFPDEEQLERVVQMRELSAKIFGPLMK